MPDPDYSVPSPLTSITPAGWRTLPEDLDHNFRELHALAGAGASASLLQWFFGNGRKVGADYTAGRIALPPTPALAFKVPNADYLIALQEVTVDEPAGYQVIGDVPDTPGVYHVFATEDVAGGLEVDPATGYRASYAYDPAAVYLGTVTSDGVTVTAVDGAPGHYIQPLYIALARIGAGGGEGGSVDLSAILARLADIETRLLALENNEGGDIVAIPSRSEALHVELLIVVSYLVEHFPGLARHIRAAIDAPGSTGHLEPLPDGPARRTYAGGNATRSKRHKAIE